MNTIRVKITDPELDLMTAPDSVIQNYLDDVYYYHRVIDLERINADRYRCTNTDIDESYLSTVYCLIDGGLYTDSSVRNREELESIDAFLPIGELVTTN